MNEVTGEITSELSKIYDKNGKPLPNMIPLTDEDAEKLKPLPPEERKKFSVELREKWRRLEKAKLEGKG